MKSLYLYCAELRGGTIKAGITENFRVRARGLAAKYGPLRRVFVSPVAVLGRSAESELLRRLERVSGARFGEVFYSVGFSEAAHMVRQTSVRHQASKSQPRSLAVGGVSVRKCAGMLCLSGSVMGAVSEAQLQRWLMRQARESLTIGELGSASAPAKEPAA